MIDYEKEALNIISAVDYDIGKETADLLQDDDADAADFVVTIEQMLIKLVARAKAEIPTPEGE